VLQLVEKPFIFKVEFFEDDTDDQQRKIKKSRLAELARKDRKCKSQIIQRIADGH
jgi:hypothetical protein